MVTITTTVTVLLLLTWHSCVGATLSAPRVQQASTNTESVRITELVKGLYASESDGKSDLRARLNRQRKAILALAHKLPRLRKAVVRALIRALDDPDAWNGAIPQGWVHAADLLAELKAMEAIDRLIAELGNPLTPISMLNGMPPVGLIVAKFGKPAVPKLAPVLSSGDAPSRASAAVALGIIGGQTARKLLSKALTTESEVWVRERIESALDRATSKRRR